MAEKPVELTKDTAASQEEVVVKPRTTERLRRFGGAILDTTANVLNGFTEVAGDVIDGIISNIDW